MAIREAIEIVWKSKGVQSVVGDAGKLNKAVGGIAAGLSVGFVASQGVELLKESVALSLEQSKAEAQLAAALESTGRQSEFSAAALKNYAGQLQGLTNFGDEATIRAQAMLLTFKEVGSDVFPRATRAIQDVSVAMDQGLKESTIQIGKALNDPIQGLAALRRVGIQFTDTQEDLIKGFVEAGNVAEAQNIILSELESQFGGSAEAAKDGITGIGNALGDTKEEIGEFFLILDENSDTLGTIEIGFFVLNDRLGAINDSFREGLPLARDYFAELTGFELGPEFADNLRSFAEALEIGGGGGVISGIGSALEFGLDIADKKKEIEELKNQEEKRTNEVKEQNQELKEQIGLLKAISGIQSFATGFSSNIADAFGIEQVSFFDRIQESVEDKRQGEEDARDAALRSARDQVDAAFEVRDAWRDQQKDYVREMERATERIKGLIEGELQPTLSEVWSAPEDGRRVDEWARRAATLATEGLNSEWISQLQAQFGGQSFWEPVAAAIQSGDDSAIRQAATDLLSGPGVSQLWDKELIKERVRNSLIEQNLRQELVDTIYAELAGEGLDVDASATAAGAALPIATSLTGSIATSIPGAAAESGIGASLVNSMIADVKENKDGLNKLAKTILEGLGSGFADMIGISAEMFLESLVNYTAQRLGLNGGTGGETIP